MFLTAIEIFFNLRISSDDLDKIQALETYYIDNSAGNRTSTSYTSEELIAGAWNRISVRIFDQVSSDSLKEIGIRIKKKAENSTPKIFIDLITTVPNNNGVQTISAPSNFQVTDTSYTELTLEWSPSEGTGVARYELLKMNRQGIPFFFIILNLLRLIFMANEQQLKYYP